MKLLIDIDDNDYEMLNKTGIELDWNTAFHGKEKDREMTFALFNLVKALKDGTIYHPQGDLISREALKKAIEKAFDKANLSEYEACVCVCEIYDKEIDNAPTVSDRYDEGYAQGYIDGSTGADWKGGAE